MSIEIHAVEVAQVLALRLSVLRPGRPPEAAVFEGDDEPSTLHIGTFWQGRIIGVASIYRRSFPPASDADAAASTCSDWQLRGMAVEPEHQGRGVGRALLAACIEQAALRDGSRLWCNARKGAVEFYRAASFEIFGSEFEIPDVGAHFVMARGLESGADARAR